MGNNKWINHVKNYANENNISYGCALSQPNVKTNYEKVIKKTRKQQVKEKLEIMKYQYIEFLKNKIKNMSDDDIPIIRMKFNSYNKEIRDGVKEKYPKYYEKLFSK